MALFLYRIGRFSFHHPWRVIVTWLVLLGAALGAGIVLGGEMRESFDIPGTESQEALDRLNNVFPEVAGASASVVIAAPAGESVEGPVTTEAIAAAVVAIGDIDGVAQVVSPFSEFATDAVSPDAQAAIITVQFEGQVSEITEDQKDALIAATEQSVAGGASAAYSGSIFEDLEYGLTVTEAIGVLFAAFVLVVAFGSVLAAGLPLASALVAVGTTIGGILVVAAMTSVSSATPLLAVMIGIAVGIDYALFVLSRHRHQLANGLDPDESAATAVGTAGNAVIFAGVTVMIALVGLLIVGIPFLGVMGVAAAIAVFLAMTAAVTLLPSLFGLAGERLRPKAGSRAHRRESGADAKPTMGRRWVRIVLRAPWVFVVLVVGVLGAVALPALDLRLALPSAAGEQQGSVARDGYDAVAEHFGEGANGPLLVMLDITRADNDTLMDDLAAVSSEVAAVSGVKTAGDALPNPTVDSAIIQVIPTSGPADPATLDVVNALRELAPQVEDEYGIGLSVTGYTAVAIDISDRLDQALVPFALVVVGLAFLLLMMVFRSVLVPLKAALSFLLSIFAAFGVVVAIFQWGWFADAMHVVPGPIISFMPVLLMAIIFGLAMDYEVFLVSGMREAHVRGEKPRAAIEHGFAQGARVVTAAALIMFFVFAAFVPEGAGVIKAIALGLAVGIAFDAFLVRMTLVPALMAIMGKWAWWLPRWLDRLLPELDIEGEHLRHHRDDAGWALSSVEYAAIGAEKVVCGDARFALGPVSFEVPHSSVLIVQGIDEDRRVFAATLAGRLSPARGRLHVLGRPLPGDAVQVRGLVATATLDAVPERAEGASVAELLRERLVRVGEPATPDAVRALVDDVTAAMHVIGASDPTMSLDSRLADLDPLARSLVIAQLALAEYPSVFVADLGTLSTGTDATETVGRLIDGLTRIAPGDVTIVAGTSLGLDVVAATHRISNTARPVAWLELEPGATAGFIRRADPLPRPGDAEPATDTDANADSAWTPDDFALTDRSVPIGTEVATASAEPDRTAPLTDSHGKDVLR
ncbi:RND transporter [Pseudoclavibacter endophyticus]|uniref:MMPL family transporter n=1 Tax=Pseudoclavibacter endophyticus TaxID=1778590 RepID=A0A6H9WQE4_9MICO|nr:MMPL family transporter [Pseudoclavibacter endophyticus]KAB1649207.1 MMPL family transporter [Pseudoclavibacter endophyticus]GGA64520.1 RND transporter [Pseudoclavibacter endophyticus]